jgi:hypothetical protein
VRQPNRRYHRPFRVAALAGTALAGAGLALLLGAAACGSRAGTPTVASARHEPAATPSPSGNAIAEYVDAQRRWVACMRQQGYNLPDPDAKGFVDLGAFITAAKLAKTDPGLVAAQTKCRPLQLPMPAELNPVPPLTAEQIANRRAYARCMRANGVPDWPDPGPDGEWPNTGALGALPEGQVDPSGNERALQVCDPVLDGKPTASPAPNRSSQG